MGNPTALTAQELQMMDLHRYSHPGDDVGRRLSLTHSTEALARVSIGLGAIRDDAIAIDGLYDHGLFDKAANRLVMKSRGAARKEGGSPAWVTSEPVRKVADRAVKLTLGIVEKLGIEIDYEAFMKADADFTVPLPIERNFATDICEVAREQVSAESDGNHGARIGSKPEQLVTNRAVDVTLQKLGALGINIDTADALAILGEVDNEYMEPDVPPPLTLEDLADTFKGEL